MKRAVWKAAVVLGIAGVILGSLAVSHKDSAADGTKPTVITNVSYDATREFYEAYDRYFTEKYAKDTGKAVMVLQSHGGSGNQARSVVEGFDADVVTLALAHDVNLLQKVKLLNPNWESQLPNYSSPYTSTIVFLVRKGNPKNIHDWNDLVKGDVKLIAPDPKSSGAACWIFLAAYAYGGGPNNDTEKANAFVTDLYRHVAVMDAGARAATTTFVENKQGDVLLAWENEALQAVKNYPGQYQIVIPSVSIEADPSVAVVEAIAKHRGTEAIAEAYLKDLYTPEAQRIAAEYGFRPTNPEVYKEFANKYPMPKRMVTIRDFGGWDEAYKRFFEDGALFDTIREG